MKIEVLGKIYEVLEIIPKAHKEYDLFLCKSALGYRECFQRIDIGRELKIKKKAQFVSWEYNEIQAMKEAIKSGLCANDIVALPELSRHTETAIRNRLIYVKRDMKYKDKIEEGACK